MRPALAALLALHALLHLLGVAKAFGYAELPQLRHAISPPSGVLWGVAALLFLWAAVGVVTWPRWWWAVAIAGVVVSTAAIVPSWSDAFAGAALNLVVLAVAVVACALDGPWSLRADYARDFAAAAAVRAPTSPVHVVTDADLAPLPPPVQKYLRAAGVVGHPRVTSFHARLHGRIRSAPGAGWMPLVADQVNVVTPPTRLFYLDATMLHLPVAGYHHYGGGEASMLVKLLGLVPVARVQGPAMTRAETVTFFNDLCVMAPATLIDPAIVWTPVDERTVRATFTAVGQTIQATLIFGADGLLTDFWSDDRGTAEGASPTTGQRWSTPIGEYRRLGPFTLMAHGEARWHPPAGAFAYIELDLDGLVYNITPP